MDMESSRRPFDRSREPGLKKPRLTEDPIGLDRSSNGRANSFIQRPGQISSGSAAASRLTGPDDSVRGPYPQQQQFQQQQQILELVNQYKAALSELTFNSKPIITNLTIIAGENLHAAKAIANAVCLNIIEVPSDQKLPSLYLLDSIVKNIGRDYIKYFAARLPEVFCKAYKQVDPSGHPGMRHLFGTWKGVFPSQTLQMIERELGFVPAANGSSSGASRSDAPSARPAHSIHVNPKYLEARQRFQQSTRVKGSASDISGNLVNSSEDMERFDKTSSVSFGRPWADPPAKKFQHPQRQQLSDAVHGKNSSVAFDDSEYDSIISKQSGQVSGRAGEQLKEQGLVKPWFESGTVTPTISDQRNGFDLKEGYSALRSATSDTNLLPRHTLSGRSASGMTKSWKNSEEEEYMWDDINSRLTDQGAINSSGRDRWTPDDSERTSEASADSLSTEQKSQATFGHGITSWSQEPIMSEGISHLISSRDTFSNSEGYPTSLSGIPKTANAVGRTAFQSKVGPGTGSTRGYIVPNVTPGPTVSVGSVGQQRQSLGASSPSVQSPMHQRPPSPSLHGAGQVVHHLSEKDKKHPLLLADPRVSQLSGQLNIGPRSQVTHGPLPLLSENVHAPSTQRLLPNARPVSSLKQSPQLRHDISFIQRAQTDSSVVESSHKLQSLPQISSSSHSSENSLSDDPNPLVTQSSGQSSTSSLLAAVMKSGILGGNRVSSSLPSLSSQDIGSSSSQEAKEPSLSSHLPTHSITSVSTVSPVLSQPSNGKKANSLIYSQKNVDRLQLPRSLPPSSVVGNASSQPLNATDAVSAPVSSLLSSLVEKGLISASKTEVVTSATRDEPAQPQNLSVTSASLSQVSFAPVSSPLSSSSTSEELNITDSASESKVVLPQSKTADIKNLIGFQFKPDVLREFHPIVISELLEDLPYKCGLCGLRLRIQERLDRHMEWHALRDQDKNSLTKQSREWYLNSAEWIERNVDICSITEPEGLSEGHNEHSECNDQMVPADETQYLCILCGELFEDFYCQERNQWMFKGAVYATSPCPDSKSGTSSDGASQGSIIHANCVSENTALDLGDSKDIN